MISCNLMGGIGNQMFQIAATYALALENKDICGFNFDTCHTPLQGNKATKYKTNVLSKVNATTETNFKHFYYEPRFGYEKIPYSKNLLLNGYFQSEKYFKDYKNEIIDLFSLSEIPEINDFISKIPKPITSLHVRRGDYLKNPDYHPPCDIEYYKNAMSHFKNNSFIILSDDMEWVNQNFNGNNIWKSTFDEIGDLKIMTLCQNNIISNSSFSWWGAYLNKNKDKTIIAPKRWFGPHGPKDTEDILPQEWLIL